MNPFTLQEVQCFDAVVREGGFQGAALVLNRSHAAVFAAVAKLEDNLQVALLDRSGYRVTLTDAGRSFLRQAQSLLSEVETLTLHARQLAMGEETHLRVVVGDTCPLNDGLELLSGFFTGRPNTRLDLHFETISGPWERLFEDEADLILHWVEKADARLEWIDLGTVSFVPVVAPGFLPFPLSGSVAPEQMRVLTQCIIRDTARTAQKANYYVVEGAPQCTVGDHLMKKEIILRGMAWGHLPRFMIGDELRDGRLLSIAGEHFPGVEIDLVAARRRDRPHGPVAARLWQHIQACAPDFGGDPRRTPV
ncbi:MAG: LysR family transcriptional regulator [Aquamicrobium sp.]|uniref:LysR family transcriptional regulator n=1 Tax=Mesorhizobium sp. Pch-S TaxID=2082387 RepID=UPI001010CA08|nr:LysR family transcriptional regulator [Mesorhizobium sp. Pch-S]MBR2689441.1 LysR family transcriptional regulator [Aquamicrobium sp.]QAZ42022.1 LysR family transcriptional regulator [Mesorhizobium sp. Pch-S]